MYWSDRMVGSGIVSFVSDWRNEREQRQADRQSNALRVVLLGSYITNAQQFVTNAIQCNPLHSTPLHSTPLQALNVPIDSLAQ
jgi:hypothetical protein